MWKPYRDAAYAALPNATVIIDKFHVVRGANIALDTVRKSLRAELPQSQRRYLKNDRFILLKRKSDLTDREHFILSGWLENYPKLALAYVAKEAFYEIYDAENLADANKRYENWLKMISHEIEPAFSDLIRAFENWNVEIMNYFQCPVTNAYTESLNNLIRVTNRMGRGYSFEALRAKILLQNGTHKNRYKKPKFERKQRESIGFEKMTGMYYMEPENVIEANLGADITTLVKLFES
jgi:transposase